MVQVELMSFAPLFDLQRLDVDLSVPPRGISSLVLGRITVSVEDVTLDRARIRNHMQ